MVAHYLSCTLTIFLIASYRKKEKFKKEKMLKLAILSKKPKISNHTIFGRNKRFILPKYCFILKKGKEQTNGNTFRRYNR